MKTIAMTVFLLALLALTNASFGQEPQNQQKSPTQLLDELQQQDNERRFRYIAQYRKETEDGLAKFNGLISERDVKLTEKLKRALNDGDETLIGVALEKIRSNQGDLKVAKLGLEESGKLLLDEARAAYRDDLITEEQYTEHLNFVRSAQARAGEAAPAALTKLIETAKQKLPEYFTRLERLGQKF